MKQLLLLTLIFLCGCQCKTEADVKVHPDPARLDIYIHRDKRRVNNPPPAPEAPEYERDTR